MANFFDQFDQVAATQPQSGANFFDKFDEQPSDKSTLADVGNSLLSGTVNAIPNALDAVGGLATAGYNMVADNPIPNEPVFGPMVNDLMNTTPYKPQTIAGQVVDAAAQGATTALATGGAGTVPNLVKTLAIGSAGGVGGLAGAEAGETVAEELGYSPEVGRVVGGLTGGLAGGAVTGYGANKALNWLKNPPEETVVFGKDADSPQVAKYGTEVKEILKQEHQRISGDERVQWRKVERQANNSLFPNKEIPQVQKILMDAQGSSGSNLLNSQLNQLNRLVEGGMDVPGDVIVGMRQALSAESVKDGGLIKAVRGFDDIIENTLKVKALPDALKISRDRFGKFVDQQEVAKAIADSTTAKTAGKLLLSTKDQAADIYGQVVKASGALADQAKDFLNRGIFHELVDKSWVNNTRNGVPIINKDELSNGIYRFANGNPELWEMLPKDVRSGALKLAKDLKASNEGVVTKVENFVKNLLFSKVKDVSNAMADVKVKPSDQLTFPALMKMMGDKAEGGILKPSFAGTLPSVAPATAPQTTDEPFQPATPVQIDVTPSVVQPQAKSDVDKFVDSVIAVESGGKNVKNPLSSASGPAQFTNSTWLSMMAKYAPEIAQGASPSDQLELRGDKDFSRFMTQKLAEEHSQGFEKFGIKNDKGNLYLAHFLGLPDAVKVLRADEETPINRLVNKGVILSNRRVLAGKTAGEVREWAKKAISRRA